MLTDLDDFYCFAQVVEHGGFSAAERATDIPKSKLSRRVYNLEERLGVRLIQRSSRHFAVTDIGMNIYRHAQVMLSAAQAAHDLVDHLSTEPRGIIKLSLPVSIAQNEIARILPAFLKQYPEIKIQMMVTNRRVDIINEGFDIALRVRSSLDDDPNLVIRQFDQIEQHLFASQGYLNEFGHLKNPEELSEHKILSMADEHTEQFLILHNNMQQQKKIRVMPTVLGSDLSMLAQLATSGCGITLLPDNVVQQYVERGELVRVLPEWKAAHGIFHMVYPSRRGLLPAVRVFIDYLVEHLHHD
ncbi:MULTISPECIES: LysR substrate-binding domain-containing protein [Acinetobacter]|uniref:LysR substrate-binding domain-containing protein n=1 Tax=Acinetobacter TaxID=469 RepID=UPI00066279F7|nr:MULTISPECIES: LysR substrate-binding domain-containing protein [Acinetobacter]APX63006.1 LysR family transcriptional regulator protein [Acinetobacter schindleri]KMV00520.1 LysR family transcriptional regulator [Acinetobacter sp. VT 511]MBB4836348.1 DNA-binding transcriptional LysR family regulator [Acinetobacter schindleri]MCU4521457.1 LysR family transcriptional regulator [Acinetobacter schindleri]MDP1443595.1 LysR substrate-binding domain-containing protein [Acinetobacter schindleri]